MAQFQMFLGIDGREIEELRPPIVMGDNGDIDLEKSLLQAFVTACADAGEHLKPKLREVCFLTERFSDINIPVFIAVQKIHECSKQLSGVNEARANLPQIFNW